MRLATVEEEIGRLEERLQAGRATPEHERGPSLLGMTPDDVRPASDRPRGSPTDAREDDRPGGGRADDGPARSADDAEGEIAALVEKAVAKKAEQMLAMREKKPSLDVLARVLGLSDLPREAAAREVVRGQHAIRSLLETPAEDGTIFLDEVVDVMAYGVAHPGKSGDCRQRLLGRLTTERVPGTDET